MPRIFVIFSMLLLCSCAHFEEDKKVATAQVKEDAKTIQGNTTKNLKRIANNVRDSIKRTNKRVRKWWITPLPKEVKHQMPVRYCYRVLQDILCYRQQMPNWENKLVGYQGAGAESPKPATMKPLALRADNTDVAPQKKIEGLKPVFIDMPKDTKKSSSHLPVAIDTVNEILPDPALAPQL